MGWLDRLDENMKDMCVCVCVCVCVLRDLYYGGGVEGRGMG